ncbi:uncharacterized protein LOC115448926 [Manduca sexta]|uniref:Uncharacterized protein n=1 Tax=Manduca sexta TaxID=7130 RepID=A0A921YNL2_MANSE|nr:uncharacterized protein LOC115448926 [Manduca sexta]KAG6441932.1 hypothetical protein O3G_MSEX002039 [Manduca sexta]
MHLKSVIVLLTLSCYVVCDATSGEIEARGKKKKIALFVFFADLVLKKIFILKLVYAFILWIVLHKAGYFLSWFATYLKEQKHNYHEYHDYHGPHHEYGPSYGHGYGPYRRQNQG